MDHEEGYGRGPSSGRKVYKNGGPGVGGALHQTPGGPDNYGGVLGQLHWTPTGAHSGGYNDTESVPPGPATLESLPANAVIVSSVISAGVSSGGRPV